MSVEHYWPGEDEVGWHSVEHRDGEKRSLWWNGNKWSDDQFAPWQRTTEQVKHLGYLGVRRETSAKPDLNALLREAITEFRRDVRQQPKAADWAFKWVGRFIEAVEK